MTENDTTEATTPTFEKGTWQDSLHKSALLKERGAKASKSSANMLWTGAKAGIAEWLPNSATDVSAEAFQADVQTALGGTSRKGDASKIKTVALAVRNHDLDVLDYPSLGKAYAKALDLTKGADERKAQDNAAEEVIESLEVPKTATTPASAALILFSKGIDGAVVAILDALNGVAVDEQGKTINNEAAHRAFMRAVSVEIASRVQAAKPKPEPKVTTPKPPAAKKAAAPKAVVAAAGKKGKPVGAVKKTAAVAPVEAEPVDGPSDSDLDDLFEDQPEVQVETPAPVKKAAAVKRPARPRNAG